MKFKLRSGILCRYARNWRIISSAERINFNFVWSCCLCFHRLTFGSWITYVYNIQLNSVKEKLWNFRCTAYYRDKSVSVEMFYPYVNYRKVSFPLSTGNAWKRINLSWKIIRLPFGFLQIPRHSGNNLSSRNISSIHRRFNWSDD